MSDNGDAIEATTTLHDALDAVRELDRELTRLRADLAAVERERDAFRRALNEIAAFGDTVASAHLKRYGSYAAFDEPGSVRIARAALEKPHG